MAEFDAETRCIFGVLHVLQQDQGEVPTLPLTVKWRQDTNVMLLVSGPACNWCTHARAHSRAQTRTHACTH
eukprot:5761995-Alexandrium_andersonii.AAC.1